ncbi:glycosyltransferase [Chitinophaga sp. 22536]|uniref:glycosyltransferase n=1 Tax=unclassified Chitinophaga TaxID=2619133 RepID=UPI003F8558FD
MKVLNLFSLCQNVHLAKDVGMIPFMLHQEGGWDATIATYKNGEYPGLSKTVPGLKLSFIKRIFRNTTIDSVWYLLRHGRKYDILILYHLTISSLVLASVFRMINAFRGKKIYLKLDADEQIITNKYKGLSGVLRLRLIGNVDVISIENRRYHTILNETRLLGKSVEYIPNGFYDGGSRVVIKPEDKQKVLLTVGRIGTHQKNNELLLDAFALIAAKHPEWRVKLVGPVAEGFDRYLDKYYQKYPHLKDRVILTGPIQDRNMLEAEYAAASIFALSSRTEGFPLVFLEALKGGCVILSTDLLSAYDVTDNGRLGVIVTDATPETFASAMSDLMEEKNGELEKCRQIQDFAYEYFYWPNIVQRLMKIIQD